MAEGRARRQRAPRLLDQIVAVCPDAVVPVARALHVRMPMQNGADRDMIQDARVLLTSPLVPALASANDLLRSLLCCFPFAYLK